MLIAIGVFAIAEILENVLESLDISFQKFGLKNLFPTGGEIKFCLKTFVSSPVIGFLVGALPARG